MFKFLISMLIFPVLFLLALDGIAAGVTAWLISGGAAAGSNAAAHSAKAAAYFLTASGLTLSIICSAAGVPLAFLSFIFKSWIRAAISIGVVLAGAGLWRYFLSIPYFL